MNELRHAVSEWIKSGHANIPPALEKHVQAYAQFHTTKAINSGLLCLLFVVMSIILWATLIKRSRVKDSKWRFREKAYFVIGMATVVLSLMMMVVVVVNIQGAFAPLTSFLVSVIG